MTYSIQIANEQDHVPIDGFLLEQVAETTLAAEGVAAAQISIAIIDNARIRILNRRYLGHDYDTDVLSFLLECEDVTTEENTAENAPPEDPTAASSRGLGQRIDGEILISAEMAAATAENFDWSPHAEIVLYLVHGLLHLVGYDDHSETQRQEMRSRERSLLSEWNLVPHYADEAGGDSS